jgi:hypothetical protein
MKVHRKFFLICGFFIFFTACSSDKPEEARRVNTTILKRSQL